MARSKFSGVDEGTVVVVTTSTGSIAGRYLGFEKIGRVRRAAIEQPGGVVVYVPEAQVDGVETT